MWDILIRAKLLNLQGEKMMVFLHRLRKQQKVRREQQETNWQATLKKQLPGTVQELVVETYVPYQRDIFDPS